MFRVKKKSLLFLAITFAFAWMEGGNLPYCLFYCGALVVLSSIFCTSKIEKNLGVTVRFEQKNFEVGDRVEFITIFKNASILPAPYIETQNETLRKIDEKYKGDVISIGINDIIRIKNLVQFRHRGIYNFGQVDVKIQDSFYLCERKKKIKSTVEVKVYPKIYNINQEVFSGSNVFGNAINNNKNSNEDSSTVRDVRKYVNGDNLKKIHWKVSARYGELYVRNLETTTGKESILFINMNEEHKNKKEWSIIEEKLVDFSASLLHYIVKRGIKSKVFINGSQNESFTIGNNSDFQELLDFFLVNKSVGEMEFSKFINFNLKYIERFSWIGMVTIEINDQLKEAMIRIKDLGYNLTLFYYKDTIDEVETIKLLKKIGIECLNYNEIILESQK